MPLLLSALALAAAARGCAAATADTTALVQGSVRRHGTDGTGEEAVSAELFVAGRSAHERTVGDAVRAHELGPVAYTKLGPILGEEHSTYTVFGGIQYVETPERFGVPQPKAPWAPKIYNATHFRKACIGASVGEHEDEDCLTLNVWVPRGGLKNMPVIVYFHGGINQHGSGSEWARRGDGITNSTKYPTIFINFNFRLGIFGWISLKGSGIPDNLGMLDQQAALRWVQEHIAAFGGDPTRVLLEGQSEGCGSIEAHMVAPGSMGLFHRVAFHSPPADIWSRHANVDRTKFMIEAADCQRPEPWSTVRCLKRKHAVSLWSKDWVAEELSRRMGTPTWFSHVFRLLRFTLESKRPGEVAGELGWHAVIDNKTLLGEPRELIHQGRFNKVPVLITMTPNESIGIFPAGSEIAYPLGLNYLDGQGSLSEAEHLYNKTLEAQGIHVKSMADLHGQMLTDKVWTCDVRSLAAEITHGGGRAYIGMFAHSPKYAPVGRTTNPLCENGAICHADDMYYVLPQGARGIARRSGMEAELAFSWKYMDSFLAFVHGNDTDHPWAPYDDETQIVTFYKDSGTMQEPRYRKPQCDVLDRFMGKNLPEAMQAEKLRS